MMSFGSFCILSIFVFCFRDILCVVPHAQVKGKVENLLKLTPWNWKHLDTAIKVDSPVSVDISLISRYRLTGKHRYQKLIKYRDCASILKTSPSTRRRNGVYAIYPDMKTGRSVYCDMTTDGGGWTVIQRRIDGTETFHRTWVDYKIGFGRADGEYWLGNEVIHKLTTRNRQELRVDLENFSGQKAYAKYSTFSLGSESHKYKLTANGYSGTAGDSLGGHNGLPFSTKDRDNDSWNKSCAADRKAAWWFGACDNSDLNGPYHKSAVKTWACVLWYKFGNVNRSMKHARMMIRPSS